MTKNTTQITKLENGLTIATDTIDTVESVSVGVWAGSGARQENKANNGIAHFLEHMVFKGTETRSARDIVEQIENVGGFVNAYTSYEMTAFYARVLKEDVPLAFDIVSDILRKPAFEASEMERERGVILQEIGMLQDSPDSLVFTMMQDTAFGDTPLGWPVIGSADVVKNASRDLIFDFMQENYFAQNLVLAAAGNINHDDLVARAQKSFGDLQSSGNKKTEQAIYLGGEKRVEKDLEQVHLVLGFESMNYLSDDYYVAVVLGTLMGGGMASRLFQEIREKRGLVYSIYSYNASYRDTGLFEVYAGTGEKEITELLPVLCDTLQNAAGTFTDAEINRAKAQIRAGNLMALESTSSRCDKLGRSILSHGKPRSVNEIITKVNAVTAEDLTRVATKIFAGKPSLSAIGPIKNLASFDDVKKRFAA